jgi:predicted hydrocarbon binding protein
MRQLRGQYKTVWYQILYENGNRVRRFQTKEEAEHFAEEWESIEKVTVTREAYVPEEAPF